MNRVRFEKLLFPGRDFFIAAILAIGTFSYYFANVSSLPDFLQFTKYSTAALKFLEGNLTSERALDFSPFYLFIFVIACKFLSSPVDAVLLLQSILVAITSGLLFFLLRRRFNITLSLAGCVAFLLSRSLMVYCHIFEPEVVLVFLLVLFMFVVELRGALNAFFAGMTLSLCLLTRPSFLLLALSVPIYYYLRAEGNSYKRSSILFIIPVLSGFFLIVAMGEGTFPPRLMNPGTVLYDANNPLSDGVIATYPPIFSGLLMNYPDESDYQHAIYRVVARKSTGKNLSASEVNKFWSSLAINYITDNPLKFIRFELSKLYYLGNSFRWHDIAEAYKVDAAFSGRYLPYLPFAFISSFALLGFCAVGRRWLDFFIPGVAVISQTLLMLVTYVSDRQRLSLLPCLIVFAVAGLSFLWMSRMRTIAAVAALIVCVVALSWKTELILEHTASIENDAISAEFQANAWALQSEDKTAGAAKAQAQSRALAHDYDFMQSAYIPVAKDGLAADALREFSRLRGNDAVSRYDCAVLLIEADKLPEAESLLKVLTVELNDKSEVLYQLGRIEFKRQLPVKAVQRFKEALAEAPGSPNVLAALFVLTGELTYIERLRRYFDEADVQYFLGLANMDQHNYSVAVDCFRKLHDIVPDYWSGKVLLAAALSGNGQQRESVELYSSAMSQNPNYVLFPEKIAESFRQVAENAGSGSYEEYLYGKVLHQTGNLLAAREVLQESSNNVGRQMVSQELATVNRAIEGAGSFEMRY
ncbi:MAG: hypothetical protein PHN84_12705 [Desulfuromonadaceae bacterium]|nr:hypothetical protein [Desulfuromonadaceae bacterium]MDD2854322.1 hypothetical protein [Desulfuromonadaceae bacterium]